MLNLSACWFSTRHALHRHALDLAIRQYQQHYLPLDHQGSRLPAASAVWKGQLVVQTAHCCVIRPKQPQAHSCEDRRAAETLEKLSYRSHRCEQLWAAVIQFLRKTRGTIIAPHMLANTGQHLTLSFQGHLPKQPVQTECPQGRLRGCKQGSSVLYCSKQIGHSVDRMSVIVTCMVLHR